MKQDSQIIEEVEAIYRWIDERVAGIGSKCKACGNCCDFEVFGHRLYVTTPELMHFQQTVGPDIKDMPADVCPYRINGKCSVYSYRFSGCRIFFCGGDSRQESQLSEQAIRKFKALCTKYHIPYYYVYLRGGLEMLRNQGFPPLW